MVFSRFAVMLLKPTIFQISVKYQSDTSFLLKPFKFCYFLLNLFNAQVLLFSVKFIQCHYYRYCLILLFHVSIFLVLFQ